MAKTSQDRAKRVFTVAEANARLPLVGAIAADVVSLARDVIQRRQRLLELAHWTERDDRGPYRDELVQIEEDLDKDTRRVAAYVEELRELGVEPKSITEGLVDFPAILDGRLVYLCWRLGEPEVGFWHEVDAGFRGRQPIGDFWKPSHPPVEASAQSA
jgi:hypothetical protein